MIAEEYTIIIVWAGKVFFTRRLPNILIAILVKLTFHDFLIFGQIQIYIWGPIVIIKNTTSRICFSSHIREFSQTRIIAKGYHPAEVINMEACIGCTSCARTCPDVVIRIEKD